MMQVGEGFPAICDVGDFAMSGGNITLMDNQSPKGVEFFTSY